LYFILDGKIGAWFQSFFSRVRLGRQAYHNFIEDGKEIHKRGEEDLAKKIISLVLKVARKKRETWFSK
jgi:hypothetical protein